MINAFNGWIKGCIENSIEIDCPPPPPSHSPGLPVHPHNPSREKNASFGRGHKYEFVQLCVYGMAHTHGQKLRLKYTEDGGCDTDYEYLIS